MRGTTELQLLRQTQVRAPPLFSPLLSPYVRRSLYVSTRRKNRRWAQRSAVSHPQQREETADQHPVFMAEDQQHRWRFLPGWLLQTTSWPL